MHSWRIWHRSFWNIRSVLSLRGIVSADKVSSELSFGDGVRVSVCPADVVRSFPAGWYWTGNPVGVGSIPPVAGPVKKKLVASVYLFADAVVAV